MRFEEAQARSGLTDRELAERAGSSTRTVWRIKQGHLPRREGAMRRLADALGVRVEGIDEFLEARRQRVLRSARKRGVPEEVLDEAFEMRLPDDNVIRRAALRSLRDTMRYLVEDGATADVDKVYREVRGETSGRKEAEESRNTSS